MVNKVLLLGNLGQDPEVRYTPSGATVCTFSIATNERWTSKDGKKEERTEWHRIVVWGKLAELCGEYLGKGRTVFVEGRLQTREWTDKQGNKRYTTEIIANNVQFIGAGSGKGGGASQKATSLPEESAPGPQGDATLADNIEEDIPF